MKSFSGTLEGYAEGGSSIVTFAIWVIKYFTIDV